MKKLIALMLVVVLTSAGCGVAEYALSDINDWDLSACARGFSTCIELVQDNQDKIFSE